MKKLRKSKTVWSVVIAASVANTIQWWNYGLLPVLLQWIGPWLLVVQVLLFRLITTEACLSPERLMKRSKDSNATTHH